MIVYLDSSVVLRPLLNQPHPLRGWGEWDVAYSSELLGVECRRVIDRLRLESAFNDEDVAATMDRLKRIESTIRQVRITKYIIRAASRTMPTVVKTLDAFHLVSAIALRDRRRIDLSFITHDAQQATAARALGFTCFGS